MSNLSLTSSVRTCRVDTGEAARIASDRFLNPSNMVCVGWDGYNSKGQSVCADSFNTKSAGCNSAQDRVDVESFLRPDYSAYINLNTKGIDGPGFNNQWKSSNYKTCGINPYERAMAKKSGSSVRRDAHRRAVQRARRNRRRAGV